MIRSVNHDHPYGCKGSESESDSETVRSARKGKKQSKLSHGSDSEGNNEEVPKVFPICRALQKMCMQSSRIEKESSPECVSEDSGGPAKSSNVKPITKRGKKSLDAVKQLDEDVCNDIGSKSDGSKSKQDKIHSSDSASDTQCASPTKIPDGPKKRCQRKGKSEHVSNAIEAQEEKELKCPVLGCDSIGHLSGCFEKHSAVVTCPLYHNTTPSECLAQSKLREQCAKEKQPSTEWSYKDEYDEFGRRILWPRFFPTAEQKELYNRIVIERREIFKDTPMAKQNEACSENKKSKYAEDMSREPLLTNLAPQYDLEMFKKAQACAAKSFEDRLRQYKNNREGIQILQMGPYEMDVLYKSPYPKEFQLVPKLYVCEYCLKYMDSPTVFRRHAAKCVCYPPGNEIYRKGKISFFEVDGHNEKSKTYCQNLCLLAKLFLNHKTLFLEVEHFLFYVMTEANSEFTHIVGYFSKEKMSSQNYNVSCILTLPPYQKKGYGRMLIDFSYLLSKVEGKLGSPEKPLSDLGLISYRSYWKSVILEYLCTNKGESISIKDISQKTSITSVDIVSTLQVMGMVKSHRGKHYVMKRLDYMQDHMAKAIRRKSEQIIEKRYLNWPPYTQNNEQCK